MRQHQIQKLIDKEVNRRTGQVLFYHFLQYFKKTSAYSLKLQSNKKQLASCCSTLNETPFCDILGTEGRGQATQKDINSLLSKHGYKVRPADLKRYLHKYCPHRSTLSHADIHSCLLPADDSTQPVHQQRPCRKSPSRLASALVSQIIHTQTHYLAQAHKQLIKLVEHSHQAGVQIWEAMDPDCQHSLTYSRMDQFARHYGYTITPVEWQHFIRWHFRTRQQEVRRVDFMMMFDVGTGSPTRSASEFHHHIHKYSMSQTLHSAPPSRSRTPVQPRNPAPLRQPSLHGKTLLDGRVGYRNPSHLIKLCHLVPA